MSFRNFKTSQLTGDRTGHLGNVGIENWSFSTKLDTIFGQNCTKSYLTYLHRMVYGQYISWTKNLGLIKKSENF